MVTPEENSDGGEKPIEFKPTSLFLMESMVVKKFLSNWIYIMGKSIHFDWPIFNFVGI